MTIFPAFLLAAVITYAIGSRLSEALPTALAALIDLIVFVAIFMVTNRFLRNLKDN